MFTPFSCSPADNTIDTVSNVVLPDSPANATLAFPPQASVITDAISDSAASSTSTLVVFHDPSLSSTLHRFDTLSATEQAVCTPRVDIEAHALPPLVFQSKEKSNFGPSGAERVALQHFGKQSSSIDRDGTQSAYKGRRGPHSPFRMFSRSFRRSPVSTVPAVPAVPVFSASMLQSALSEKEMHLQEGRWEESNCVVLQVKLPV